MWLLVSLHSVLAETFCHLTPGKKKKKAPDCPRWRGFSGNKTVCLTGVSVDRRHGSPRNAGCSPTLRTISQPCRKHHVSVPSLLTLTDESRRDLKNGAHEEKHTSPSLPIALTHFLLAWKGNPRKYTPFPSLRLQRTEMGSM